MPRLLIVLLTLFLLVGCASSPLPPDFKPTPETDILASRDYKRLVVEVMSVYEALPPSQEALDFLQKRLEQYCNKDSVEIIVDPPIKAGIPFNIIWTDLDLMDFELKYSRHQTSGDKLVRRILYLPGSYQDSNDSSARGITYSTTSCAVFRYRFSDAHERAVILHEFGHLMGLVKPTSLHHEPDPKHRWHCKYADRRCVMFWCSPTIQNPDFDDACRADIFASGGKRQ